MDKRRFNAYRRRIIALKEARQAYIEAEIEHLRFRENGSDGKLPKHLEARLRQFIYASMQQIEIANLRVMNKRMPHVEGDHYDGDGCLSNEK
jgi:hypothetical protein